MLLWMQSLHVMLASHIRVSVQVLADLIPKKLPVHMPGQAAEDGPKTWSPAIHMEDPDGISGLYLLSGPARAVAVIWGVNQGKEDSLSLTHLLALLFK